MAERAADMGVDWTREIRYPETSRRDVPFARPARSARLGPGPGPVVLMFGTDAHYRGSYVYLARCLLADLDLGSRLSFAQDLAALPSGRKLQYLQWVDYSKSDDGEPFWTEDPKLAMPLFMSTGATVGQPHVVREPKTGLWLMTHEGPNTRNVAESGLRLRWAKNPWGPWGATSMVNPYTTAADRFEPTGGEPVAILFGDRDQPYGNYMHDVRLPTRAGRVPVPATLSLRLPQPLNGGLFGNDGDDGLSDDLTKTGATAEAQGAYGAYMVVPWFRYRRSPLGSLVIDVVYALATGNPFQVQLMSTSFEVQEGIAHRVEVGTEQRPRRGW